MYRSFDEDVLLCPESVVADIVASAVFDDELELPDLGPFERSRRADAAELDADATECEPQDDETIGGESGRTGTRTRRAANGR